VVSSALAIVLFLFRLLYLSYKQGPPIMASGAGEDAEKAQQRKKQIKKMGKLLAKIWELDAGFHPDLMAVGTKIDQGSYSPGKAGWHEFCNHVGGIYQNHIIGYVAFHSFPVDGCRNYTGHQS
jgi:hypothetical protein